ncbi:MAG: carbon-nitrogen hydrolase [Streptosporangiales bacterium]|nr:carbon-nitrogen hydrolase [Streptosporangiales bacterium]
MTAGLVVRDARSGHATEPGAVCVAVCQLAPVIGDRARNVDRAIDAVTAAADAGAHLVVLPELVSSGYVFADRLELGRNAEWRDGATVSRLAAVAQERGVVVVAGFPERGEDGGYYNSAALIDVDGLRAVYQKVHLWDAETELFTPGAAPPVVADTSLGRVGVVVCYDLEFPEWMRLAALAGAEIICAPTNWPGGPCPAGERPVEVVRVQASASVNRCYVAAADRVGTERGVDWVGGSAIRRLRRRPHRRRGRQGRGHERRLPRRPHRYQGTPILNAAVLAGGQLVT